MFKAANIQFSQKENTSFAIRPQFQVHKTCFPALSKRWKETPRTHCSIPWEKKVQGRVFLSVDCHTSCFLIKWKYTVRCFSSKKCQEACFFQKTQILEQSCGCNEKKMNQNLFKTNTILVNYLSLLNETGCLRLLVGMDVIWQYTFT